MKGVLIKSSQRLWWGWLGTRYDFVMVRTSSGLSAWRAPIERMKTYFKPENIFYVHYVDDHQASLQVSTALVGRGTNSPVVLDITYAGSDTVDQMITGLKQRNVPVVLYTQENTVEFVSQKYNLPVMFCDFKEYASTPNLNSSSWKYWVFRSKKVLFGQVYEVLVNK